MLGLADSLWIDLFGQVNTDPWPQMAAAMTRVAVSREAAIHAQNKQPNKQEAIQKLFLLGLTQPIGWHNNLSVYKE